MITTRPATQADEDTLLEVYAKAVQDQDPEIRTRDVSGRPSDTEPPEQNPGEAMQTNSFVQATDLSEWLKQDGTRVIVAEERCSILGWGVIFLDETLLATIFVDPEAPRIETRDRLLTHVERIADDVGITQLPLLTY
ncbi:GNAT family N-acetyltransferase [Halalkaliarchaeum desulfuricum]|nr:hypothetical protein [Halalkaliarchaeum desulfuricum]